MAKIEIFQFCIEYFPTTLWVKNSVQIALSLTVSEILIFFVFRKNSRWPPKVAKIEFFQFHIEYSATTLWVKNSVQIALSLTVSKILTFFVFPQKFKMAAKSGENWNFSILYRILSYYPTGQKFCPNHSIAYSFWDVKIFVFRKNSRWPPKVAKIEFFQFHIEYSATTLWVKNSVEIALSLTVSEILTFFVFLQKFKMAAKSGENWNFSILYRILSYYPMGQNFCPNRSISYGFWDIQIFSFFAKIQDGRQKWRKLKFLNFCTEYFSTTLWVKNSVEIALSLTVSEILTFFCFSAKIQDGRQKWRKLKFFNFV